MRAFFGWCAAVIAIGFAAPTGRAEERPIGVRRDGSPIVADVRTGRDGVVIGKRDVAVVGAVKSAEVDSSWVFAVVPEVPTAAGYPPEGSSYDGKTNAEQQYLWRWLGMEAPDLVVEVVAGDGETWFAPESNLPGLNELAKRIGAKRLEADDGLVTQLVRSSPGNMGPIPALRVVTNSNQWQASLSTALDLTQPQPSPARAELQKRAARSAKEIVEQLLPHYGRKLDFVAYIPALAVLGRVRQEKIDGGPDAPLSEIVQSAVKPYLDGTKKSWDGKGGGSGLSGHLLFGELAELTGDKRYVELVLSAANIGFDKDGKPLTAMPTHTEMSDAVFMGCPILAQAGKLTGDAKYQDMCLTHLKFMEKLCLRQDGLYRHSPLDEAAWGRGNGFPALGLCWSLDELPESFAGREYVLKAHQVHLAALLPFQDATGMWHQVIDRPESYREFTATAMICYAMMRGVQEGRLDRAKYAERIDRAWAALKLRIATDGTLVDVCTGTGKQKSLRDYYDRPAILGRDDRGGAMALMVATERELYEAWLAKK
jgi:rhamnogalacturonyl hydrolase YesR